MLFLSETQSSFARLFFVLGCAVLLAILLNPDRTAHRFLLLLIAIGLALRYILWRATETLAPFGINADWFFSWSR
jgi:cellulose synthase (UDP-forming)